MRSTPCLAYLSSETKVQGSSGKPNPWDPVRSIPNLPKKHLLWHPTESQGSVLDNQAPKLMATFTGQVGERSGHETERPQEGRPQGSVPRGGSHVPTVSPLLLPHAGPGPGPARASSEVLHNAPLFPPCQSSHWIHAGCIHLQSRGVGRVVHTYNSSTLKG